MPVYCIVGYGRQGLVAGETIVVQVLSLLPLNTGTVDVLLPLSVLVWSLSLGRCSLECKLYNWESPELTYLTRSNRGDHYLSYGLSNCTLHILSLQDPARIQTPGGIVPLLIWSDMWAIVHFYTCKPLTSGKFNGRGLFWTSFDKCYRVTGNFIHLHIMYGPPLTLLE